MEKIVAAAVAKAVAVCGAWGAVCLAADPVVGAPLAILAAVVGAWCLGDAIGKAAVRKLERL